MKYTTATVSFLLLTFISINAQKSLPATDVVDIEGSTINVGEYTADGNPKLVSLWATWCGPCRMELNSLKKVYPEWKDKYDLEIVAISVDVPQMVDRAKKMFASNGWDYTFLHDNQQALMSQLGIRGIPYSMLIDGNGKIISTQMGFSTSYEAVIEEKLKAL